MSALLIGAFAFPSVAGSALLLAGGGRGGVIDRTSRGVAVIVAALTFAVSLAAAVTHAALALPFIGDGSFVLSVEAGSPSEVVLPTVTGVATLVLLFAAGDRIAAPRRFSGLILIFVASVILTVTAASLPVLLLAWEIMGATSYALIGLRWWEPETPRAGFVAFIVTRVGDLGLYLAAGAAIAAGTGWNLDAFATAAEPWRSVIAAGLLVAGVGKAAQLPFSFWLSRAMVGPSAVSALLHSAAMVAMGAYLLLRVQPTLAATGWAAAVAALVGLTTSLVLGVVALAQTDLKQVLAASTASQLGFVVLAAGVGAVTGGTALLVAHAATKSLLFVVAGAWLTATGTRQLEALGGVARRWRTAGICFAAGGVVLAGLPPFALWLGKDGVLATAFEVSPLLWLGGIGSAAVAAAYSARIVRIAWGAGGGNPRIESESGWDDEERGTRSISRTTTAAAVGLAIVGITILAVVVPLVLDSTSPPRAFELIASALVTVVVFAIVLRFGVPRLEASKVIPFLSPAPGGWLGLERAAQAVVARPVNSLVSDLSRFDTALDRVVDGVPRALGAVSRASAALDGSLDRSGDATAPALDRSAERVRRKGDLTLDGSVEAVARGAGALGRRAARIQSGDLSFYYSLAVVFLAAAVLILIVVGAP